MTGPLTYAQAWRRQADAGLTRPPKHTIVTLSTRPNNYLKADDRTVYLFRDGDETAIDTLADVLGRRRCVLWRPSAMLGDVVRLVGDTV